LKRSSTRAALLTLLGVLLPGCASTPVPHATATTDVPSAGKFPHARFGLLLSKIVDAHGQVDYQTLEKGPALLDEYLSEVARVSPDSHPHLFPTEDDRLAYWINVHNACALRAVLSLRRPATLAGIAHRLDRETVFTVGGKSRSLLDIVDQTRKRFPDPRVHFVFVRGRRGGPPLLPDAIDPKTLDETLEKAARAFVADPRNVESVPATLTVKLNRVFLDYRDDFERQTPATVSGAERLVTALNRWRAPGQGLVAAHVEALPFDERLNEAGGH
jgi:hypothetical protein